MSKKISITLDDEILSFIDQQASNRSRFINDILKQAKHQMLMEQLANAYEEQANDPDLQEEIKAWDVTVGDGIDA